MSYVLKIKPQAIAQAAEIYAYHQGIDQRLADRFSKELDACYAFIERNPIGFQVRKKNYRHAMVKRFRYRVVFALIGQEVVVFQIRHTSRRPSKKFGP
ncbi:MAG: type II toxin-antitoxin system RelE/ParE family toxin [Flavobacteriales bacterium]|nr:type II toxin-antitoxin system RelE/ParE family toxin [Flavobacteriales bacterium]